ncbi:MAG: S1C family serine protease [Lachnospiraceae bacterium]|nr:S1C family serine protease [Lachnospiraceae bacterium]
MTKDGSGEFAFIKETNKHKPINKRRVLLKTAFTVVMAVVFGMVACFVFTIMQPVMERWLHPEDESFVSIPRDDENGTDQTEDSEQGTEDVTDTEPVTDTETPPPVESVDISPEDYQKLQNKLYSVGTQANKSIVTVTGVTSDLDWFNTPQERQGQASGIIIADTAQEFLILTERRVIQDAQSIHVTFVNNTTVDAYLKQYDGNTGIAILGVQRSAVDEATMNRIEAASLGNSTLTTRGSVVLALGSPLGANFSISVGTVTATDNTVSTYDANYSILTTDIVGSREGSGVLVNLSGEVIGIVIQDYGNDSGTLTALSISQLKDMIERLSNGRDIPYLGLKLSTVTSYIQTAYDIPKGVYIKTVAMDSPAMAAGLQSGDVIVAVGGQEVDTVQGYRNRLSELTPGTEVEIEIMRQGAQGYTGMSVTAVVGVLE